MTQEEARNQAKELFKPTNLCYKGQGFWVYKENLSEALISRKGLEHCVSDKEGVEVTLITRNDQQSYAEYKTGTGSRSTVLQQVRSFKH